MPAAITGVPKAMAAQNLPWQFAPARLDMPMATAAQIVQAIVVLTAVFFGYFTSMNQALIGAMAGAGFARGRDTIDRNVIFGILRGWIIGPAAGAFLGFVLAAAGKLI